MTTTESHHEQTQPLDLKRTADQSGIGVPGIGRRKYEQLKGFAPESLTDTERIQIEIFESRNKPSNESMALTKAYSDRILSRRPIVDFKIGARDLWELFKIRFVQVNGVDFLKNPSTLQNLEPLIYYFSRDERFFNCENLSAISEPSFEKGLLIIGTFGNGKTAVMRTFENIFKGKKGAGFKGYSANEVVQMYETCGDDPEVNALTKSQFDTAINKGNRYFDDLKTERMASNYGKVNIFKDVLETRYANMTDELTGSRRKTFVTCNYKPGHEGNVDAAVDEFGEKYGGRVYDRMFEMFNILIFDGKSFRK